MAKGLRVFEELAEGLRQPVVLLDKGLVVDLRQEGRALLVLGRGGDEVGPRLPVEPLLVSEHLVPEVAAAAKGFFKQLRLGRGGVEPGLDGGVLDDLPLSTAGFSRHFRPTPSGQVLYNLAASFSPAQYYISADFLNTLGLNQKNFNEFSGAVHLAKLYTI